MIRNQQAGLVISLPAALSTPDRQDGQPDKSLRHPEPLAHVHGTIERQVRAEPEAEEADNYKEEFQGVWRRSG